MDLKDFIVDTISQISEAVIELNKDHAQTGLIVNPIIPDEKYTPIKKVNFNNQSRIITRLEFDLSLSATDKSGSEGKVSVFSSLIGASGAKTKDSEAATANRLQFYIDVMLPQVAETTITQKFGLNGVH